ncbi:MAG: hypothetical protein GY930_02905 [bacterium]|nr:hypothetical protein [bacterium]
MGEDMPEELGYGIVGGNIEMGVPEPMEKVVGNHGDIIGDNIGGVIGDIPNPVKCGIGNEPIIPSCGPTPV